MTNQSDDDRALFKELRRLGVPLSGTDRVPVWWIALVVALGLLILYFFAGKR